MEPTERLENDLRELAPRLEQARERLREANERVLVFVKERPVTSLLAAVAVGFLIGRLVRRRGP